MIQHNTDLEQSHVEKFNLLDWPRLATVRCQTLQLFGLGCAHFILDGLIHLLDSRPIYSCSEGT